MKLNNEGSFEEGMFGEYCATSFAAYLVGRGEQVLASLEVVEEVVVNVKGRGPLVPGRVRNGNGFRRRGDELHIDCAGLMP